MSRTESRSARDAAFISVAVRDLKVGDVMRVDGRLARVIDEPDIVHYGLSPFDELRILGGVRICFASGSTTESYVLLEPSARIPVLRNERHLSRVQDR